MMASFLQIVVGGTAALVTYYVISAFRSVYFHPLAKYPGPFLSKFSGWPSFWHTTQGNRHIWLWQLHEVYGPIVRYRHDSVVITTPEALQAIYNSRANVQKASCYLVWPKKAESPNTFSCVDKQKHARRRRILNAAISDKAIRSAQPYIISHVDRWLELLSDGKSEWSEPRNLSTWADSVQFDIMAELCYGKSFSTKEPGENTLRSIPHDIADFMWLNFRIMHSPFVHLWVWLKPRGLDAVFATFMPKKIKHYVQFVEKGVVERLEQEESVDAKGEESDKKDMLHYLFRAVDPDTGRRGYSRTDLLEEADMLTVAATDTTAAAVAAAFFYLARSDSAYDRLRAEIRETFQSVDEVRLGSKLSGCKYLHAVIKESLRMSPPGANEMPREVLPGGMRIGEEYFPPGVNVGCAFYALFHNEDVYGDPSVFRPERWIVGDGVTEQDVARAESAFAPFSVGVRGCPGKGLAMAELAIVFARLVYGYEFKLQPGDRTGEGDARMIWGRKSRRQYQTRDAFVPLRDGPWIQFAKRQQSSGGDTAA